MIEKISHIPHVNNVHKSKPSSQAFEQFLESEKLKFSQHAQSRLRSDGIELSSDDLLRIGKGVQKAETKGAHESLLLMDDKAFIVNIKEKMVITSIHRDRLKENIFTNIDSAVII